MKNKTPIVIELHDDGFVKVYATEQRPDVSIVIVNRPYSEHDIDDAGVATSIDAVVAGRLPYPHRQAYLNGWTIKTHLKERWDADRLERVKANRLELQIMDAIAEKESGKR